MGLVPSSYFGLEGGPNPRVKARPLRAEDMCQVGSLAGAAHPLKDNAGVPRGAHRGQKPRAEQKGRCPLDLDFQCEYKP